MVERRPDYFVDADNRRFTRRQVKWVDIDTPGQQFMGWVTTQHPRREVFPKFECRLEDEQPPQGGSSE